jgi:hypothetical protein
VSGREEVDNQEGGRSFDHAGHDYSDFVNPRVRLGRRGGAGQIVWVEGVSTGRHLTR